MPDIDTIADYDTEDIEDAIPVIEKSLQVRFRRDAFLNVQTVGDLVEVVHSHITLPHNDSCTSKTAFYKVRKAIAKTQLIDPGKISPDTSLDKLFPLANRRQQVKAFKDCLNIESNFLQPPQWVMVSTVVGLILSLIGIFFSGVFGLIGIVFFIACMNLADKAGKNFTIQTVRELAKQISDENYLAMRRIEGTVNRNEIMDTVVNVMSSRLGIDKKYITPESRFSWAKPVQA